MVDLFSLQFQLFKYKYVFSIFLKILDFSTPRSRTYFLPKWPCRYGSPSLFQHSSKFVQLEDSCIYIFWSKKFNRIEKSTLFLSRSHLFLYNDLDFSFCRLCPRRTSSPSSSCIRCPVCTDSRQSSKKLRSSRIGPLLFSNVIRVSILHSFFELSRYLFPGYGWRSFSFGASQLQ